MCYLDLYTYIYIYARTCIHVMYSPRLLDHHPSQVKRTSFSVPPAVPVADPPSVMRLANALVEHFGSLSLGLHHLG